ncbi:MAG: hypothetical protein AAGH89_03115 [Verrucomicrobiota bacterium]
MTPHSTAKASAKAYRSFKVAFGAIFCAFLPHASASEEVPVSESTVTTIAAAIASDMGGDAAQYVEYAEKLGITLTTLTRPQQEDVLDEDPGGLLGVLESAPEETEESGDGTSEETLGGTTEEEMEEPRDESQSGWEEFWNWLTGLFE